MSQVLSNSAQKIQEALGNYSDHFEVVELSSSTRTADEAAVTIGCKVAQIIKSLIFKKKASGHGLLILASGINRVNETLIKEIVGDKIERADPDFVREVTGFAIGGIPPIGHATKLETLIDKDLLQYEELWAAAGTPSAVFSLQSADLQTLTGGRIVSVR